MIQNTEMRLESPKTPKPGLHTPEPRNHGSGHGRLRGEATGWKTHGDRGTQARVHHNTNTTFDAHVHTRFYPQQLGTSRHNSHTRTRIRSPRREARTRARGLGLKHLRPFRLHRRECLNFQI